VEPNTDFSFIRIVCNAAMEMIADGRINIEPLITHTFDSTQFPEAYDMASNYRDGE
jgi:alcohol dehydrogenase